jgi:Spy/CpxP family protein refolding chaperone
MIKLSAMKYALRIITPVLLLFSFSLVLNAQEGKGRQEHMEKFRSMKIAYFTENLELTPEEAEKFWPLYNDFDSKKREVSRSRRRGPRNINERLENMTDQEAEKMADDMILSRKKEVELDEAFHEDLKKILPPKKVMKYYITEYRFREYMLRKIRDERRGGNGKRSENPPSGRPHP